MPIAIAFALLASPAQTIFDQSLAAFRARKAFSVKVALDAKIDKKSTSARYLVSFQAPRKALITKIVSDQPTLTFWLDGSKFVAYDPAVKEMVVRKTQAGGSVAETMASEIGAMEDPVKAQLSPETMAAFFDQYRAAPGWVSQTRNGTIMLTRSGTVNKNKTFAELDFSASTKLMTRSLLVSPNHRLEWVFSYGPAPRNLTFRPPAETKKVTALSEHIHIAASDPKARLLVDESLRSYARLTSISYSVVGPDGPSVNRMQGSSFAAKQGRYEWSYHAGVFTLKDLETHKSYRGTCRPNTVLSYLKKLGSPMDPILLALYTQRNPISSWFIQGCVATRRGTVTLNGVTAHAIELRSARNDVSLLIRSDNHLVSSVASRVMDPAGKLISDTHRQFTYSSVNKPLPATAFTLTGSGFLPLSKIGK